MWSLCCFVDSQTVGNSANNCSRVMFRKKKKKRMFGAVSLNFPSHSVTDILLACVAYSVEI
jgi:hypothetical protein